VHEAVILGTNKVYTVKEGFVFQGLHINISHLQHMGRKFADALLRLKSRHFKVTELTNEEGKPLAFS